MKIYAISGLGADKRVFQFLNLNHELVAIDWINPESNESISSYASRLSKVINQSEKYGILGVSFGGLVAVEISKNLNPEITILISSVETSGELRWVYRFIGKIKLINFIPSSFLMPPKKISAFLFGTKNSKLLNEIIEDTDLHFAKWSIRELLNWPSKDKLSNCLKINGTKDLLMPSHNLIGKVELVKDGGHFMIVDKAEEISKIINSALSGTDAGRYLYCRP